MPDTHVVAERLSLSGSRSREIRRDCHRRRGISGMFMLYRLHANSA